jgi:probable O-glycosylation ligase (exosortase A-associated)
MRVIVLVVILIGSVPICIIRPYYGILMWFWVAYFNPHRYTWGDYYTMPAAAIVAVPTLLGTVFAKEKQNPFAGREALLLLLLWGWFGLSFFLATQEPRFVGHMFWAQRELVRFSKNLFMIFIMISLVTSVRKLKYLLLLTVSCFGLLALKAVLFGVATSGQSRVWGPPDSFIADNNSFALALNMVIPILFFLAREENNRLVRRLLYAAFACCVVSVVLTYSRGGQLGLVAVLAVICIKARRKALGVVLISVCALGILTFAPEKWMDRMSTTAHGELDQSAEQRLVAWRTAWRLVQDYPIAGAGFDSLPDEELFMSYQAEPLPGGFRSTGPHSIYFQMMADQGFVGLGIFLAFIGSCIASLRSLRRKATQSSEASWVVNYTHMIETALIGYLISGAFLGLGYFDLFYQLASTTIVLKILFRQGVLLMAMARPQQCAVLVEPEGAAL